MNWALLLALAQVIQGTLAPRLAVMDSAEDVVEFHRTARADGGEVFTGEIRGAKAIVSGGVLSIDLGGWKKFDLRRDGAGDELCEIDFPLPGPVFRSYPVRVRMRRADGPARVAVTTRAYVPGSAKIGGREVAFGFQFDPKKNNATADDGWQLVDGDEFFVMKERPVYHAAGAYFSIGEVDLTHGSFTLTPRSANEYTRILLKPGEIFPDFSFIDFEGRAHRLSDYAGKRVLLDFWATWCPPCIDAIPKLRALHAGGLEIVGMNVDRDVGKARAMQLEWVQAPLASIREIVEKRAHIETYPTYVLLDGGRRIVAVGDDALK